jgi:ATP-dependent Clp protease ATP-binding subunit ClpA
MFERFTSQSRRVVVLAQEEARMLNHNYIGTEHLLLGLLHEGSGTAATALTSAGITLEAAQVEVESIIGQGKEVPSGHIPFTARAKKCLELSLREALQLGDNYIGTGHLLLGLIRKGDGVGVQVLERLGADLGQLRHRVTAELENDPEAGESADEPPPVRPSRQVDTIRRLLDTIDNRLSSIEGHLGITRAEPTAGPAGGAAEPEAGGAGGGSPVAAGAGAAGGGSPVAGGAGGGSPVAAGGSPVAAEIGRLNAEVIRLKALLREHDIDPGEPGTPGAATG